MDLKTFNDSFRYDKGIPDKILCVISDCIGFLQDNKFPIVESNKLIFITTKSTLVNGYCEYKDNYYWVGLNVINFNREQEIINTIYHELIHTINIEDGHGDIFNHYAKELGKLTNCKIKITDRGRAAVNSDLDNLSYEEQINYIYNLIKQNNNRVLMLIPECVYYLPQENVYEIIEKIIDTFDWEVLYHNEINYPIIMFLDKKEKFKYFNRLLCGFYNNKVYNLKSAMFIEGMFAMTKYYTDVREYTEFLIA